MLRILEYTVLVVAVIRVISSQMLPDSQAYILNELEHLYLDNTGPQGVNSGIVPCTNYVDSTTGQNNNSLGRQTSAQWIRVAFRKAISIISSSRPRPLKLSVVTDFLQTKFEFLNDDLTLEIL